jgi:hypothetical protein
MEPPPGSAGRARATIHGRWPAPPKTRWLEVAPQRPGCLLVFKERDAPSSTPHRVFELRRDRISVGPPDKKGQGGPLGSEHVFVLRGVVEQAAAGHSGGGAKLYPHPIYVHADSKWEAALLKAAVVGDDAAAALSGRANKGTGAIGGKAAGANHRGGNGSGTGGKGGSTKSSSGKGGSSSSSSGGGGGGGGTLGEKKMRMKKKEKQPAGSGGGGTSLTTLLASFPPHLCEKALFQCAEHLKNYPADRPDTFAAGKQKSQRKQLLATPSEVRGLAQQFVDRVQVCPMSAHTRWRSAALAPRRILVLLLRLPPQSSMHWC